MQTKNKKALTKLDELADCLRMCPPFAGVCGEYSVGFKRMPDAAYSVQLRLQRNVYTVGRTEHESVAAAFADCCRYYFAPWLRQSRHNPARYNMGPKFAETLIAGNSLIRQLLRSLEELFTDRAIIKSREIIQAGLNVRACDATQARQAHDIAELRERIDGLEQLVKSLRLAPNRDCYVPAPEPKPIHKFVPPGTNPKHTITMTKDPAVRTAVETLFNL